MNSYDPDKSARPDEWLQTDEGERIELVASYHRRQHIRLPNAQLHAVIHVIIENQLALGEEIVLETLARLQGDGLSRHDAVHAIGSILVGDLYELLQEGADATSEPYRRYLDRLQTLTASNWHA